MTKTNDIVKRSYKQMSDQKNTKSSKENPPAKKDEEKDKKVEDKENQNNNDDDDQDYGGIPSRSLKKNLGCGG